MEMQKITSIGTVPTGSGRTRSPDSAVVDGRAIALNPAARTTLGKWLAMMAQEDFRDLPSILAVDAVYHSPVEWHPYPGRDLVCLLVRTAASVLEDLEVQRQFGSGDEAVLEFSAHVGDIELKAVHILRFNDAGEIVDIDLIARPAKGVMALGNGVAAKAAPQIKAALVAAQQRGGSA
jgi:SnoaL-like domain